MRGSARQSTLTPIHAKAEILTQWLTLPEGKRRTEQDAAGFVLRLLVEHPELARIDTEEQPFKLIKSWLCETLNAQKSH